MAAPVPACERSPLPDLWEVAEVAAALRISRTTIDRYIAEGKLAVVKLDRRVLVTGEEVAAFIARNTRRAGGSQTAEG